MIYNGETIKIFYKYDFFIWKYGHSLIFWNNLLKIFTHYLRMIPEGDILIYLIIEDETKQRYLRKLN